MKKEFNRKIYNVLIIEELRELFEKYPDIRFHQLLQSINLELPNIDQFNEESEKTYANMLSGLLSMKEEK